MDQRKNIFLVCKRIEKDGSRKAEDLEDAFDKIGWLEDTFDKRKKDHSYN